MTNFNRYSSADDTFGVLCDHLGDGNRTIVLSEIDEPVKDWKIAVLMNNAFKQGYLAAQADIRFSLEWWRARTGLSSWYFFRTVTTFDFLSMK